MDSLLDKAASRIRDKVTQHIQSDPSHTVNDQQAEEIVEDVKRELSEDKDLGRVFAENEMPLTAWMLQGTNENLFLRTVEGNPMIDRAYKIVLAAA